MGDKKQKSEVRSQKSHAPNVQLAGNAEALGAGPITVGMTTLPPLPDEETQRAGFYYKDAAVLLQTGRYKMIVEKGK